MSSNYPPSPVPTRVLKHVVIVCSLLLILQYLVGRADELEPLPRALSLEGGVRYLGANKEMYGGPEGRANVLCAMRRFLMRHARCAMRYATISCASRRVY